MRDFFANKPFFHSLFIPFVIFFCGATILSVASITLTSTSGEKALPKKRHFELTYSAVFKDMPARAQLVEIWLPYPTSNHYQKISNVKVSSTYPTRITKEPAYGNQTLYLVAKPPFKDKDSIQIEMKFEVIRTEYRREDLSEDLSPNRRAQANENEVDYLKGIDLRRLILPDALVPTDGRIKDNALKVVAGRDTVLDKARAIYDHVTQTIKYDKSGEGWGRGDALYACDIRRGNCTDFHALIIGMSRSIQIPAIFEIGFPLPKERGSGEIPGYHCWAELYVPEIGWIPIDSSEASKNPEKHDYYFGGLCENRVQMSVGRDITLVPKQSGKPLNYFIYPHVEVDGKEYDKVEKRFSYIDLP